MAMKMDQKNKRMVIRIFWFLSFFVQGILDTEMPISLSCCHRLYERSESYVCWQKIKKLQVSYKSSVEKEMIYVIEK